MKKYIIISIIFFLSFICAVNGKMWFLNDSDIMTISLSVLGVSFTTYCFLFSPILNILEKIKKIDNMEYNLNKLLDSLNKNLKFIFYCIIILLFVNIIYSINIAFISNPLNINFDLFRIISLKLFIKNLFYSLFLFLQLYAFYDTMTATFRIFKNCFFISD